MVISRLLTCLALCLFIAGCADSGGTATGETEAELGGAEALGPAESINQAMADAGDGTETETADGETTTPAGEPGTIALTPENTQIQFIGTHAGDEPNPRECEFTEFSGTATVGDDGNLTSISVEIQTDSVSTFDQKLTTHLMSEDFLDVRAHPTIVFETTGIEVGDSGTILTGNLTLMGTTQEVSIPADVSVADGRISLDGNLKINRSEYGMDKMLERVNDEVEINITVENAG